MGCILDQILVFIHLLDISICRYVALKYYNHPVYLTERTFLNEN